MPWWLRATDGSPVRARLRILLVVGGPLAGADLLVKAAMATDPLGAHHRSHAWVVVSVALLVVAALSMRLPSRQFALAVCCGQNGHASVCTSTDKTAGRSRTMGA